MSCGVFFGHCSVQILKTRCLLEEMPMVCVRRFGVMIFGAALAAVFALCSAAEAPNDLLEKPRGACFKPITLKSYLGWQLGQGCVSGSGGCGKDQKLTRINDGSGVNDG